jgi:ABC-2 type transport system ATP-binding protein
MHSLSAELAIDTDRLRKVYGDSVAVNALSLQVVRGEAFGFLGPNGAGKTTSIKMLLSLVEPTDGSARVLGAPLGDREARRRIGFLPEHFRFHDWLSGEEFLTLHGRLHGLDGAALRRQVGELLDRVGLTDHGHKALKAYSKGMLQRVGLAQAMINDPHLVVLDEPTSGLDPVGRLLVRDIIRELRARGTTVFINSHFLSEVEVTCDRVAFLKRGEVIHSGPVRDLDLEATSVTLRAGNFVPEAVTGLRAFGEVTRRDGDLISLKIPSQKVLPEITRFLVGQGVDVYELTPHQPTLEELFIQIVGTEGEV